MDAYSPPTGPRPRPRPRRGRGGGRRGGAPGEGEGSVERWRSGPGPRAWTAVSSGTIATPSPTFFFFFFFFFLVVFPLAPRLGPTPRKRFGFGVGEREGETRVRLPLGVLFFRFFFRSSRAAAVSARAARVRDGAALEVERAGAIGDVSRVPEEPPLRGGPRASGRGKRRGGVATRSSFSFFSRFPRSDRVRFGGRVVDATRPRREVVVFVSIGAAAGVRAAGFSVVARRRVVVGALRFLLLVLRVVAREGEPRRARGRARARAEGRGAAPHRGGAARVHDADRGRGPRVVRLARGARRELLAREFGSARRTRAAVLRGKLERRARLDALAALDALATRVRGSRRARLARGVRGRREGFARAAPHTGRRRRGVRYDVPGDVAAARSAARAKAEARSGRDGVVPKRPRAGPRPGTARGGAREGVARRSSRRAGVCARRSRGSSPRVVARRGGGGRRSVGLSEETARGEVPNLGRAFFFLGTSSRSEVTGSVKGSRGVKTSP